MENPIQEMQKMGNLKLRNFKLESGNSIFKIVHVALHGKFSPPPYLMNHMFCGFADDKNGQVVGSK